jgi:N-acetyl sugar amidotransferase
MAKKYQLCSRCVMDTSVSDILFDANGVCNYCSSAFNRIQKELFVGAEHQGKLAELIEQIKREGKGKPYDCIIGLSGGVDSSYVAYLTKRKFGLRPLAVHLDNGWNSELSVKNIEQLITKLDIDLYTHVIDWNEFRSVQKAFLTSSIANCEIPTDHAIVALLYRMAAKHRTRFIITGGNIATESIMPDIWMEDAKDLKLLKIINKTYGGGKIKTLPTMSYMQLAWNILIRKIRYVGILNYLDFDKNKAISILETELGWKRYEAKHFESIYTRFFQGYLLPTKFGIDKRRAHLASLIVSGQLSRDEALKSLLLPPLEPSVAAKDVEYVLSKLEITNDDFKNILATPIKYGRDYSNTEKVLARYSSLTNWVKNIATQRSVK